MSCLRNIGGGSAVAIATLSPTPMVRCPEHMGHLIGQLRIECQALQHPKRDGEHNG